MTAIPIDITPKIRSAKVMSQVIAHCACFHLESSIDAFREMDAALLDKSLAVGRAGGRASYDIRLDEENPRSVVASFSRRVRVLTADDIENANINAEIDRIEIEAALVIDGGSIVTSDRPDLRKRGNKNRRI